jgi:hypothetical protein
VPDISRIDTEKPGKLLLKDRAGSPDMYAPDPSQPDQKQQAYIMVYPADSRRFREARSRIIQQRPRGVEMTDRELDQEWSRIYAAVTAGWGGFFDGANAIPCTEDTAFTLYDQLDYIKRQISTYVGNLANFT